MHALEKFTQMRLITIITLLTIFFSSLLLPLPSTSLHIQFQPSLHHQASANNYKQHLSLPALHRKLRFTHKVEEYAEVRDIESHKQEWIEGDNPSKYFTMDYHNVRKRPPIHNKHFQDGP